MQKGNEVREEVQHDLRGYSYGDEDSFANFMNEMLRIRDIIPEASYEDASLEIDHSCGDGIDIIVTYWRDENESEKYMRLQREEHARLATQAALHNRSKLQQEAEYATYLALKAKYEGPGK